MGATKNINEFMNEAKVHMGIDSTKKAKTSHTHTHIYKINNE